jgi:hypothetical protein
MPRTNWHKGAAVEWIMIYGHLGGEDVLIVEVGAATATYGRYQLAGPAAVHQFLFWLAQRVRNN